MGQKCIVEIIVILPIAASQRGKRAQGSKEWEIQGSFNALLPISSPF